MQRRETLDATQFGEHALRLTNLTESALLDLQVLQRQRRLALILAHCYVVQAMLALMTGRAFGSAATHLQEAVVHIDELIEVAPDDFGANMLPMAARAILQDAVNGYRRINEARRLRDAEVAQEAQAPAT